MKNPIEIEKSLDEFKGIDQQQNYLFSNSQTTREV